MMMRATDSRISSKPANSTSTATASPARYSERPWPYGCPSSAGLPAILNPTSDTTLLVASMRLFTASATIEMDPDMTPAVPFAITNNTLQHMPVRLIRRPKALRSPESIASKSRPKAMSVTSAAAGRRNRGRG